MNSLLSRAASAVAQIKRQQAEALEMDSQMDGGEFSSPANERQTQRRIESELQEFGFTPESYDRELMKRTSHRFAYFSGLYAEK